MSGSEEPVTAVTEHGGPWAATWFDDSPRGPTFGVRNADEVLCYTSASGTGELDARRIAEAMNSIARGGGDDG